MNYHHFQLHYCLTERENTPAEGIFHNLATQKWLLMSYKLIICLYLKVCYNPTTMIKYQSVLMLLSLLYVQRT